MKKVRVSRNNILESGFKDLEYKIDMFIKFRNLGNWRYNKKNSRLLELIGRLYGICRNKGLNS